MTNPLSFTITGPDGDGFVWLHQGGTSLNLGTKEDAAEAFSQWLGEIDYQEHGEIVVVGPHRK